MNLAARLARHALERPDDLALTYLVDGEGEQLDLSYAALDAAARRHGRALRQLGMAGQRVVLALPSGLDFVIALFGCFYAGAIAVPAPALRAREVRVPGRTDGMLRDCGAALLVVPESTLEMRSRLQPGSPLAAIPWLSLEALSALSGADDDGVAPNEVAFLQYTSGSTAEPKGVVVSHANLVANFEAITSDMKLGRNTRFLSWLPLHHDMGLIGILLKALHHGNPLVLMSPAHFIQRPIRWLNAISRFGANLSGGPNFAYDLCVRKIGSEGAVDLRLDSWTTAFNGAEPVRAETLKAFADAFAPYGFRSDAFYPCYGMAETTLYMAGAGTHGAAVRNFETGELAAGRLVDADPGDSATPLVSSGRAPTGHEIVVADPATCSPRLAGVVGEILVRGPSVSAGYWGVEPRGGSPFGQTVEDHGDGYFRTGDLGAVVDGQLFVTGRLKDLIIIRGRNIYPQDVERTSEQACSHLDAGSAAAFCEADGEGLVVVQELRRTGSLDTKRIIRDILSQVAAEHDVRPTRVVVAPMGALLKTSSGKLRRAANRLALASGELPVSDEFDAKAAVLEEAK